MVSIHAWCVINYVQGCLKMKKQIEKGYVSIYLEKFFNSSVNKLSTASEKSAPNFPAKIKNGADFWRQK